MHKIIMLPIWSLRLIEKFLKIIQRSDEVHSENSILVSDYVYQKS